MTDFVAFLVHCYSQLTDEEFDRLSPEQHAWLVAKWTKEFHDDNHTIFMNMISHYYKDTADG